MKQSKLIVILLCCAILLSMASCRWVDDYGHFSWQGIGEELTKRPVEEYPDGPEFKEFMVSGVTVFPVIRPAGGDRFGIAFFFYAREPIAEAAILQIELVREGETLLSQNQQLVTPVEWAEEGYYFGSDYYCFIPVAELGATRGTMFQLTARVRVSSTDGSVSERTITYTADVYQHKVPVFPT